MPFTESFSCQNSKQNVHDLSNNIVRLGSRQFFCFVIDNRLAPLWFDFLTDSGMADQFPSELVANLRRHKLNAAALQLIQAKVLNQVQQIFEAQNIHYLVFKGAGLGHTLYEIPVHRPSADIDIHIYPKDRDKAVAKLAQAGFDFYADRHCISHEVTLTKHSVAIDLHWALLRPGRTRMDVTGYLFANAIRLPQFWALNNQASLFVMLMHPVFTKHLNSPSSLLINLLDLQKLLQAEEPDWHQVISILSSAGNKTAAWCSLYWLQKITGTSAPAELMAAVQPGRLRQHLARYWIERNSAAGSTPFRLQWARAFSLTLQDSVRDSFSFLLNLTKEKLMARRNVNRLTAVFEQNRLPAGPGK